MNIALVGYGKMGRAIEEVAVRRGHQIILKIGSSNRTDLNIDGLRQADVAIEFTHPGAAPDNVAIIMQCGVPVVSGTTGWNEALPAAAEVCRVTGTAFLHASNFSIGVNIFFEVNKLLARLMNRQGAYDVTIEETHHTEKKDAPSGTAITLAGQILEELERKDRWTLKANAATNKDLAIESFRVEGVPGTHKVSYHSPIDTIDIIHTAHSREGFALGAVLAAEFIAGRQGVFTMEDVLGIH